MKVTGFTTKVVSVPRESGPLGDGLGSLNTFETDGAVLPRLVGKAFWLLQPHEPEVI